MGKWWKNWYVHKGLQMTYNLLPQCKVNRVLHKLMPTELKQENKENSYLFTLSRLKQRSFGPGKIDVHGREALELKE